MAEPGDTVKMGDLNEGDWILDKDEDLSLVIEVAPGRVVTNYWNTNGSHSAQVELRNWARDNARSLTVDLVGQRIGRPGSRCNFTHNELQWEVELLAPAPPTVPAPPKFTSVEEAEAWLEAHSQ